MSGEAGELGSEGLGRAFTAEVGGDCGLRGLPERNGLLEQCTPGGGKLDRPPAMVPVGHGYCKKAAPLQGLEGGRHGGPIHAELFPDALNAGCTEAGHGGQKGELAVAEVHRPQRVVITARHESGGAAGCQAVAGGTDESR